MSKLWGSLQIHLAAAYEVEVLYAQGGLDALGGLASVTSGITEKIGDYSISTPYVSNEKRRYDCRSFHQLV